jgi:hypothetical protein
VTTREASASPGRGPAVDRNRTRTATVKSYRRLAERWVADTVTVRARGDVRRARRAHPEATVVLIVTPRSTTPVRCAGVARPRERRCRTRRSSHSTSGGADPGDEGPAGDVVTAPATRGPEA